MSAGTRANRMRNASRATATANPVPISCRRRCPPGTKEPKTAIMMTAAPVMTPLTRVMPSCTARALSWSACHSSWTRLSRNTW